MIVVSDSSPLIALARIGRLNLLASLYERIVIPTEVHHEVAVVGRGLPGSEQVRSAALSRPSGAIQARYFLIAASTTDFICARSFS